MRPQIKGICRSDLRQGADRLHDVLDGRIEIPERIAVVMLGIGSALIPFLVLCKIGGVIWADLF